MTMPPLPTAISETIKNWPETAQGHFSTIRATVFLVAGRDAIGPLVETLKWGQPSWLPEQPKMGTTLRCNWSAARSDQLSLFVHCQTTLLETIRTLYPQQFNFEGKRALHLDLKAPLPVDAIEHCALLTLSYHRKTA